MQVFILGMHRSGTSALARVLNLMGLYFGGERVSTGRNRENRKGFWERRDVRMLNDTILFNAKSDWDCVSAFDVDALSDPVLSGYRTAAADIVMDMDAHRPWFLKEPRLCLLFPIWRTALEVPFCIHIHRNPLEVAHSLKERNGIPIRAALALWEQYNRAALRASEGLPRHIVSYVDLLDNPAATVESIRSALVQHGGYGLRIPGTRELGAFLDHDLRHHRSERKSLQAVATRSQLELYGRLTDGGPAASDVADATPTKCIDALRAYEATVDLDERIRRWRTDQERRSQPNTEMRLALTQLDLRHARTAGEQSDAKLRAVEKKVEQSQRAERDLTTKLAVRDERIREFGKAAEQARVVRRELAQRESEVRDLATKVAVRDERIREFGKAAEQAETVRRDLRSRLVQRESEVRELTAKVADRDQNIRESQAALRELKVALSDRQAANATLQRQHERLRVERADLLLQRDGLHRYRAEAQREAAAHRDDARTTLRSLDAQIAFVRGSVVELDELTDELEQGLRDCLVSRRWRVGSAFLSLRAIAGRSHTLGDRLDETVSIHHANQGMPRAVATTQTELLETALAHYQPKSADDSVATDAARRLALSRMLYERCAQLGRLQADLAGMRAFADQLALIVDSLQASRRWRLGDFLLSLHRRLLGRGRPLTAVHALSRLVAEYRSDKATPPDGFPAVAAVANRDSTATERPADADHAGGRQRAAPADDRTPATVERPSPPPASVATSVAPAESAGTVSSTASVVSAGLAVAEHRDPVEIVVCVHNAIEDVRRCLGSVLARSTVDYRLIVVNDGSDAETTTWLRRFADSSDADVELIETQDGPLGYTRAANCGLEASTASAVVLLNSDTIVPRLWLEAMLDCMHSDESVGIVGPLSNAASWQSVPNVVEKGVWAVNQLPPGYNVDEFAELVHAVSRRQFPRVDFVNGFCFMISRTVIDRIGLLDEVSFPRGYGEENDYCLRSRDAGFELAIADQCFVYHAKSKSFGHAARQRLAKAGGRALHDKHGAKRVEEATARLKECAPLNGIRTAVRSRLEARPLASDNGADVVDPAPSDMASQYGQRILYVLPVRGGSGGANSVIQEVLGMRALGVDAKVATHVKYIDDFRRFYADLVAKEVYFVFFDSDEDLLARAEAFDVIVATLWSSPAQIAPVAARHPEKLYVYYVQDYEPWFFPTDEKRRTIARHSYTLIPNMVLMAKTDWICRTVRERHGRDVYRIAPSLDHDVYFPLASSAESSRKGVLIAAMIRPTTPRRAPLRTLRVLQDVVQQVGGQVSMLLFGCEPQNLTTYVGRNAPELRLDSSFENRGILSREGVADLLREADVFVDFSDYQAFGRTGLEAMACGCAVVLPAVGGVYEYALDGENCLVVDTTSFDEMAHAVKRLVQDSALRERLRKNGLSTAAGFDIVRASLSELSVFRAAAERRNHPHRPVADAFRRGGNPVVRPPDVVVHVLVGTPSGGGEANDPTTQRVLLPLRHRALRNQVRVVEARAVDDLDPAATATCIVYDGTVKTRADAEALVARCGAIGADLVYGAGRVPAFADAQTEEDAAAEVLVRNAARLVVPQESLRAQFLPYNGDVAVVSPALDERIWLEGTVHGERTLDERDEGELRCVVLGPGGRNGGHAGRALETALAELGGTMTAEFVDLHGWGSQREHRPDGLSAMDAYRERIVDLRTRNRWQIGVLPVAENLHDADLAFLGLAAFGCSIVCPSRGSHVALARHRENAIVVDDDTPAAWTAALQLLAGDQALRESLRDQAKLDLDSRHLLNRCAPAYFRAFRGREGDGCGPSGRAENADRKSSALT